MVRNNKGGKKSKGIARKYVSTGFTQKALRVVEEEGELYAAVTKNLGNGMVEVKCLDGKERICTIRQKFKGRSKRDNTITVASWILVGSRDWETTKEGKKPKCDLLEVYSNSDVEKLKKLDIDWTVFSSIEDKNGQKMVEDDGSILFEDVIEEEQESIKPNKLVYDEDDDDEIDIDDI